MKLENKLKIIAVVGGLSLGFVGCGHYLPCPAYTNNSEERRVMKMDSVDMVMSYNKQECQLNN